MGCVRNIGRSSIAIALLAALTLAGCAAPPAREINHYDFGITVSNQAPRISVDLVVAEVLAPSWMENTNVFYRLAYVDAARPQAYAQSRWVMAPSGLLTQRLRSVLRGASKAAVVPPSDATRTETVLRVDLEEFAQIFDTADKSRGVLRANARLLKGGEILATRAFAIELPAASPNAEGGVRALSSASDALASQIADWIAATTRR